MKAGVLSSFISAVEDADIKVWSACIDTQVVYHHDPDNKNIIKCSGDTVATVRFNRQNDGPGKVYMSCSDVEDIHEVRTSGDFNQIKQVLEALGISITDDDMKILVAINAAERDIIPPTGDYNGPHFVYLTEQQYDALSDDAKAKYDQEKEEWEEYLKVKEKTIHSPVQVTLGYPY